MKFVHHRINDPNLIDAYHDNVMSVEVDLRTNGLELKCSHDIDKNGPSFDKIQQKLIDKTGLIILNSKESGVEGLAHSHMIRELWNRVLFLDSQIPDIIRLSKYNDYVSKFIIRVSEFETFNLRLAEHSSAKYMWVDYNFRDYDQLKYTSFVHDIVDKAIKYKLTPIFVLPELYGIKNIDIKPIIKEFDYWYVCGKTENEHLWTT